MDPLRRASKKAWDSVPAKVEELREKCAEAAKAAQARLGRIVTSSHVGGHYRHQTGEYGLHGPGATPTDLLRCKVALADAGKVREEPLTVAEACGGAWVKVAYSPTLRRAGELLNFFPGKYPGGIPNAPSPLAAPLSGSLLGAGLGYGMGHGALWAASPFLPDEWDRKKLPRSLATMGGLAGAVPGLVWAGANAANGKSVLSPSPLDGAVGSPGGLEVPGQPEPPPKPLRPEFEAAMKAWQHKTGFDKLAYDSLFGQADRRKPGPLDVNTDALGRTLWETGAPPALAGTTMGAMYAASRLPGGVGDGWVTPSQVAELALRSGQGYLTGALVGATLGVLTGLPASAQNSLRRSGALLGVVSAVVPKLFGG